MTVNEFNDLLKKKILILDGATGTELQKRGMPNGVCPEQWVLENPEVIIEVQKSYVEAGSDVVYSCTFGANRVKLEEYGLADKVYEMNKRLAEISREAVGDKGYVAGDISSTGQFVEPSGEMAFDEAVSIFKEQAQGLYDGGVDFFVVETIIDIQELRAAIIGIKEVCELPILASMTFSEDGYTLTGTDRVTALNILQSLGAAAVGCNCSTGPVEMLKIIKELKPYAKVPLLAKPNAGLPRLVDGKTVFDMTPEEFGSFAMDFAEAGINIYGGCCGTAPAYIAEIAAKTKEFTPIMPEVESLAAVSSARKTLFLDKEGPLKVIGERINPTGKKKFQEKLREGKLDDVKRFAAEQESSGADLLDVNMGMSGIDECEMLLKSVKLLSTCSNLPLVIDSSDPEIIERALKIYPGRALINSISAEKHKMKRLLKAAADYGAMFILLPLTDDEIPPTAEGRIKVVEHIYEEAQKVGLTKDNIIIDGLVMTVSSDQQAALETLKFIRWCRYEFGVNTTCGLSNVSFGLPQRKWVNSAFMSMAIYNGLTTAISNPNEEILMYLKMASDVLVGNDKGSKVYINEFAGKAPIVISKGEGGGQAAAGSNKKGGPKSPGDCVIDGDEDIIEEIVQKALDGGAAPSDIVDNDLIPAINKVGDLYDKKVYFLPQLIASADTMKKAFIYLEPMLEAAQGEQKEKPKVIMATVKGDIHDIGKNIVTLMLRNYGFDVIDLGKDVPADVIIDEAVKLDVKVVGLSALMTTTMTEMKTVVDKIKEQGLDIKVMIGGAVVNQSYADEIGAAGYAKDSIEAVRLAKKLAGLTV